VRRRCVARRCAGRWRPAWRRECWRAAAAWRVAPGRGPTRRRAESAAGGLGERGRARVRRVAVAGRPGCCRCRVAGGGSGAGAGGRRPGRPRLAHATWRRSRGGQPGRRGQRRGADRLCLRRRRGGGDGSHSGADAAGQDAGLGVRSCQGRPARIQPDRRPKCNRGPASCGRQAAALVAADRAASPSRPITVRIPNERDPVGSRSLCGLVVSGWDRDDPAEWRRMRGKRHCGGTWGGARCLPLQYASSARSTKP
jgi:hypothetical protein